MLRGHQAAARVAGTVLLVGALTYTFLPVRERLESPIVDDEVSKEMQVSDFLNHSVSPATVLYSNFNYPVFAYYTNLRVHRLPESGSALYDELNRLPGDGILIACRENDVIADPRLEWLDSNPHFRRFREFPSLVLYEYRASALPPFSGRSGSCGRCGLRMSIPSLLDCLSPVNAMDRRAARSKATGFKALSSWPVRCRLTGGWV
jgi:hypothetical protein